MDARPCPPGDYEAVVVGSGPGGLQTSYWLRRLGVRHALLSADEAPGGMFRTWPVFGRLLSWTKQDAPVPFGSREYEWYDHNSLVAEEPELRALVARRMGRTHVVPTREELVAGHAAFAERLAVRYGCRWEATRRDADGRLVLTTSDGEYRAPAAVFALGVTEPWRAPIPGLDDVPHYSEVREPEWYAGKTVLVVGKRNSGFELATGLLPWARRVVLVSPRPVDTSVLAQATVRVRYYEPLEDAALGGGTLVLDAAVRRIERTGAGFRAHVVPTGSGEPLAVEADAALAATGFRTPLRDLPELGVRTVANDRLPALGPFFESTGAPGVFFAGNATQGAPGLRKEGVSPASAAVHGFRYNARVLAEHLAERLGRTRPRPRVREDDLPAFLAGELARAPELWAQKGYLARVVSATGAGLRDEGIVPLEHFVDAVADGIAATVEIDSTGRIHPVLYVREAGRLRETPLDPHPFHAFDAPSYRADVGALVRTAVAA